MTDEIQGWKADVIIVDDLRNEELRSLIEYLGTSSKTLDNPFQGRIIICHPEQSEFIKYCGDHGLEVILQTDMPPFSDRKITPNPTSRRGTIAHNSSVSKTSIGLSLLLANSEIWTIDEIDHRVYHDQVPKKIVFKQAQVRQSFRQSMRSVNRNR